DTNAGVPYRARRPALRHVRNRRDRGGTRGRRAPCPPRKAGSQANRRPSSVPRAEQVSPGAAGSTAEQQSQAPAFAADGKNCADSAIGAANRIPGAMSPRAGAGLLDESDDRKERTVSGAQVRLGGVAFGV